MKKLISQAVFSSCYYEQLSNNCIYLPRSRLLRVRTPGVCRRCSLSLMKLCSSLQIIFTLIKGLSMRDILMDVFKKLPLVVCLLFGILVLFAWTNLKTHSFKGWCLEETPTNACLKLQAFRVLMQLIKLSALPPEVFLNHYMWNYVRFCAFLCVNKLNPFSAYHLQMMLP